MSHMTNKYKSKVPRCQFVNLKVKDYQRVEEPIVPNLEIKPYLSQKSHKMLLVKNSKKYTGYRNKIENMNLLEHHKSKRNSPKSNFPEMESEKYSDENFIGSKDQAVGKDNF